MNDYEDIINLKHHESNIHSRMSLEARSAQFAPFAALTGYEDEIKETSRQTIERIILNDDELLVLNNKIKEIINNIKSHPQISVTYFIKDNKKNGGLYTTINGSVTKIDEYNKLLYLDKINIILLEEIINIENLF